MYRNHGGRAQTQFQHRRGVWGLGGTRPGSPPRTFTGEGAVKVLAVLRVAAGGSLRHALVHIHTGAVLPHPAHFALAAVSAGRARALITRLVTGWKAGEGHLSACATPFSVPNTMQRSLQKVEIYTQQNKNKNQEQEKILGKQKLFNNGKICPCGS